MTESCSCGAQLVEGALFCHKCGRQLREIPNLACEAEHEEPARAPERMEPAAALEPAPVLIGFGNRAAVRVAAMAAVLCSLATLLPFPSFLVILWRLVVLVAAGFIAVHWYQRRTGEWLNVKSGIRLGWMTGFFSYLIAVVLTVFAMAVISASEGGLAEFWRKQLAAAGGPESEEAMRILGSTEGIVFLMVLTFAAAFLIFTALPMIGGALGAKVLEKE